jgi:hypothetical protein
MSKALGFSFFVNQMFEISTNFMGKVLKRDSITRISFFHEFYYTILYTCSSKLTYRGKILCPVAVENH